MIAAAASRLRLNPGLATGDYSLAVSWFGGETCEVVPSLVRAGRPRSRVVVIL